MYNEYFGFSESPFSIAPDPRYLFMSERHREALAHLLYGLKVDGGFVLLTGEVGTGKTTICRCLLEQVPENCDIAFIINPKLTATELLRTLCEELHIEVPAGIRGLKALVDLINIRLLESNAHGRKTVLIVDEAQNLSNDVLEQLRLLTNLETNQRKLLQIILLGQPELRERLAEPSMLQLAQRIVARYHLEPLSRPELATYVQHRLAVAGGRHTLFPGPVLDRLYRLSGGTPRLINVICDRSLLGTWAEGRSTVSPAILDKAAREVLGPAAVARSGPAQVRRVLVPTLAVALLVGLAGWAIGVQRLLPAEILHHLAPNAHEALASAESAAAPMQPPPADADHGLESAPIALDELPVVEPSTASEAVGALQWSADTDHWLHEALAVRALFQLWRIEIEPVGVETACQMAEQRTLRCLRGNDGLDSVRALNSPAIIELRQSDGPNFLATLVSIDGEMARIAIGGESTEFPVDRLGAQWTGEYTLLWRTPPGRLRVIGPGAQGADVAWVDRLLARWEGADPDARRSDVFTAAMAERVRVFQRAHGLADDGIVGPMTLVRLGGYADEAVPMLAGRSQ